MNTRPQSTTTKLEGSEPTLEPCPLSHYVHAGLRAHKTGLDPRIVCLDCGLTLRAPDWIKVYERWQSRVRVSVDRAIYSELIHIAAELARGDGFLSTCAEDMNPRLKRADILKTAERQEERLKDWAYRVRQVADKLSRAASPVAPQQSEPQYLTINGQRRMVIPCPDGIPGCEVLHTAPAPSAAADDESLSDLLSSERLSTQEAESMKNYDDFRAGMLRAAEMARNEFKRAPEAAKGHDCVYMGGYEDACDHLSGAIAQAAVIDCVRIAGSQPDWQYHIALLLPEGIADEALLKIYQVVEHELRTASSSSTQARAAVEGES